jgi:hypothetical protein
MAATLLDVRRITRRYPARTVLVPTAGQRHSRLGSRDRAARLSRPGLFVRIAASCGETAGSQAQRRRRLNQAKMNKEAGETLDAWENAHANGSPRSWKRRPSPGRRRRSLHDPEHRASPLEQHDCQHHRERSGGPPPTLFMQPRRTRLNVNAGLSHLGSQVLLIASSATGAVVAVQRRVR